MSNKTKTMVLMTRDRKILKFLFQNKIASYQIIKETFFLNRHKTVFERRIRKLLKFGYIRRVAVEREGINFFWACFLSSKGFEEVQQASPYKIIRKELKSDSPEHDLNLLKVKMKFLQSKSIEKLYSENELQSYQELQEADRIESFVKGHFDAALRVVSRDGKVKEWFGLEYEETPKSSTRYKEKLEAICSNDDIYGVMYVCKMKSTVDRLRLILNKEKSFEGKEKVYFISLDEILESEKYFILKNIEDHEIKIRIC